MITIKDVEHVAKLARLELTEEEKVKFSTLIIDIKLHLTITARLYIQKSPRKVNSRGSIMP